MTDLQHLCDADITVSLAGHVATVTLHRPPHNFVDPGLVEKLADRMHALDADDAVRAVVLASEGKSFCAGAQFNTPEGGVTAIDPQALYRHAMRLFDTRKPIVAAVHGPAIGAGTGLALVADFRIASSDTRFSVNFNRLGFHPGFALSYTLPQLIGRQKASLLFYTGRRIGGEEAVAIGLADELAPPGQVLARAQALAEEIAASAPQAVQTTRATLREGYAAEARRLNLVEAAHQHVHFASEDFKEGVVAMGERRLPVFTGR
jgi:enoyl-CoA hydratase/carnithine racemase